MSPIVGLSEAAWVAIVVAIVAAAGSVGAAWAANAARRQVGHAAEDLRDRIGEPNGKGNVVQMLTTLLNGQAGQDNRIARLEGVQVQHGIDIAALQQRLHVLERRGDPPSPGD